MAKRCKATLYAALAPCVMLAALAPPVHAGCMDIHNQVDPAYRAGDLTKLGGLYEEAVVECDGAYRAALGRRIALAHLTKAQQIMADGGPVAAQEALLRDGLQFGRPWQILAMFGDVTHDRGAYGDATLLYQEALDTISDPAKTPKSPKMKVKEAIFKRAQQSWLLADSYVPTRRTSGAPGGLARASFRGFTPKAIAIPLQFEFDLDVLTPNGRAAAKDLLAYLKDQDSRDILLVGHTDPTGPDDYNISLSLLRAETVKRFLLDQGYEGAIRVEGRGESEPLDVDSPSKYSEEQLHRMYRRVELVR